MNSEFDEEAYIEDTLDRIRFALVEAIRREVQRRAGLGLPLVIAENGIIKTIWPKQDSQRDESNLP